MLNRSEVESEGVAVGKKRGFFSSIKSAGKSLKSKVGRIVSRSERDVIESLMEENRRILGISSDSLVSVKVNVEPEPEAVKIDTGSTDDKVVIETVTYDELLESVKVGSVSFGPGSVPMPFTMPTSADAAEPVQIAFEEDSAPVEAYESKDDVPELFPGVESVKKAEVSAEVEPVTVGQMKIDDSLFAPVEHVDAAPEEAEVVQDVTQQTYDVAGDIEMVMGNAELAENLTETAMVDAEISHNISIGNDTLVDSVVDDAVSEAAVEISVEECVHDLYSDVDEIVAESEMAIQSEEVSIPQEIAPVEEIRVEPEIVSVEISDVPVFAGANATAEDTYSMPMVDITSEAEVSETVIEAFHSEPVIESTVESVETPFTEEVVAGSTVEAAVESVAEVIVAEEPVVIELGPAPSVETIEEEPVVETVADVIAEPVIEASVEDVSETVIELGPAPVTEASEIEEAIEESVLEPEVIVSSETEVFTESTVEEEYTVIELGPAPSVEAVEEPVIEMAEEIFVQPAIEASFVEAPVMEAPVEDVSETVIELGPAPVLEVSVVEEALAEAPVADVLVFEEPAAEISETITEAVVESVSESVIEVVSEPSVPVIEVPPAEVAFEPVAVPDQIVADIASAPVDLDIAVSEAVPAVVEASVEEEPIPSMQIPGVTFSFLGSNAYPPLDIGGFRFNFYSRAR